MFKKYLLLTFLIISPIFLSACNNQKNEITDNILYNELNTSTELINTTTAETILKTDTKISSTTSKKSINIECHNCEYCKEGIQKKIEVFTTDKNFFTCKDCSFDSDCSTGYVCNNNICINKKTIDVKPLCQTDENNFSNCEHIDCEGCKTETAKCINSTENWNNNKCIDCNTDYDCKENYTCRNFTCLKISEKNNLVENKKEKISQEKILKTDTPYYDDTEEYIYTYDSSTEINNNYEYNLIENQNINTYFCGNLDCFEDKFSKCNSRITFENKNELKNTRYEIIGYESGKCKIKLEYLNYPNSELENKEMICLFDNSKTFKEAEYEVLNNIKSANCTGDLANLLKMF